MKKHHKNYTLFFNMEILYNVWSIIKGLVYQICNIYIRSDGDEEVTA